ncbi:MAG: DNA/RNA non-specific endonuclease [Simplicispira sp.]|nr:DNA/RNA non-specific endonuclease [Simplicispira sp.]
MQASATLSKNTPEPASRPQASGVATNFGECAHFFAGGKSPIVHQKPKLRELCYDSFAILHSGNTRTPVFVAQRLNRQSIEDADEKRTDKFFADARLPKAERAELSDYKGSGYARGHMAPAGDMPNVTAMAQSFSLANIVPQNAKQNSGPWAKIERDTRHYVKRAQGDVFVITGPSFAPGGPTIGPGQVAVPTHLFKLVYDAETKRAWAHWQQNADDARAGPPISYGELVQRVGMELLPGMEVR